MMLKLNYVHEMLKVINSLYLISIIYKKINFYLLEILNIETKNSKFSTIKMFLLQRGGFGRGRPAP